MVSALIAWTKASFLPYGSYGLFVLSFIESSFFPIPPDFLLITLALADPKQAIFLAFICSLASVLGGLFGYGIGNFGGRPLLAKMFSEKNINKVHRMIEKYEAWAIGIAALTPIPYKVFTVAAGVFKVNLPRFILASLLGRSARFFLVAILIRFWGESIVGFIDKYFELITIGSTLLVVAIYVIYKFLQQRKLT